MMKRYTQFDELKIEDFEREAWKHPLHKHNHFEIIFIAHGSCIHHLNGQMLPYNEGHLYLLGPEDEHEFIIEQKTRFIYYKFTNLYLDTKDVDDPIQWNRDVDAILRSAHAPKGNLLHHKNDQTVVKQLLELVVDEYKRNELLSKKIILQYFKALVLILKRNLKCSASQAHIKGANFMTNDILEYIDLNVYAPKMLTQKQIAAHFHLSPNYVGTYFKDKVGVALKKYIQQYRFNLLEQRLHSGQSSTQQLAIDFGFTDESHLHKFVKTQSGKNLVELKHELSLKSNPYLQVSISKNDE